MERFAPRLPVHICRGIFVTDWNYSHGSWTQIFSLVTRIYGSSGWLSPIMLTAQTESVFSVLFLMFSSYPSTSSPAEVSQYMQIMPPALLSFSMVTCGHYHHGTFALRWNAHVSIFDLFWLIFSWLLTTQCVSAIAISDDSWWYDQWQCVSSRVCVCVCISAPPVDDNMPLQSHQCHASLPCEYSPAHNSILEWNLLPCNFIRGS